MQSSEAPITLHPSPQRRRQAPKGRQVSPEARALVARLLGDAPPRRDLLIEHLHRLQDAVGHLKSEHLAALAETMRLSQAEVFEVASFYHHFDLVKEGEAPPPPVTVRVCSGLACRLAGAEALEADLAARAAAAGGTGGGGAWRVIPAPCIGRCDTAPAAVVHQQPVAPATADAVAALADASAAAADGHGAADDGAGALVRGLGERACAPVHTAHRGLAAYRAEGGYALWQACLTGARTPEAVIEQLSTAGLRGLGGAGFPAGRKWATVRAQPGPRWLAINIDEGEPGTFKDRFWLEQDPHRFLEGALIACWAVGIAQVVIYLRDEYHALRRMLEAELAALQASDLGPRLPAIDLRRGAGAYICGEESAMIESIEGKRGWPRLRPPYVAQVGLFGRPTLAQNMETLHWVREILERGGAWFASQGRHGRSGLRAYSVSGRVNAPGVKLAPAGITLRELVDDYCGGLPEGHELYAYLPGGASGGILPARLADLPLDFDTLQPHGCFIGSAAVTVLTRSAGHWDPAIDAARNAMAFFRDESCGQCTPCRVGTAKVSDLIAAPPERWDRGLLEELSAVMRDASICGLGQAAPNPVDCVLRYFEDELAEAGTPTTVTQPSNGAA